MTEAGVAARRVPLLEAIGISKSYGALRANDAIDLAVAEGEIHALLGENGAGKSTLVKIFYGLLEPSAGELRWRGAPIALASPAEARSLGIAMVFQHFSLFENLTVAENVALGLPRSEPMAGLAGRVRDISRAYGLPLDPHREVWRLSVGERQRIEIVRALLQDPRLLILDEPTAVLTPQEGEQLFAALDKLRRERRAILYISHKLEEVQRLCDVATVLRAGKVVTTCDPQQESSASLARMMVGETVPPVRRTAVARRSTTRLRVSHLNHAADDPHGVSLVDVTLEVMGGEILGIAGVAGNGQDELFAVLSGETPVSNADAIAIDGKAAGTATITERRRMGAAFVPEERLGHAAAPRQTLSANVLLTGHATGGLVRHGIVDRKETTTRMEAICRTFDVRKAAGDPEARTLSGGNLQKFVVGREIVQVPNVLVIAQPTWGVDAGAAAAIQRALLDLAARGSAVLVISQDLDELLQISDRIAVMFNGRLSKPMMAETVGREEIGLLMGGVIASHVSQSGHAARP